MISAQRKKILVVEDDDKTRRSLIFVLEDAGYKVSEAPDGEVALAQILENNQNDNSFDLLLTDICMPRLTGVGLVDEIREIGFVLPVLVISGQVDEPEVYEFSRKESINFISKPFGSMELLSAVKLLIDDDERKGRPGSHQTAGYTTSSL